MIVKVGENTYGWGSDVRPLPNDPGGYGPKVIDEAEAMMLFKACEAEGWELFSKVVLEGRQVFLVAPKAWRRPIQVKLMPTQILQVRERPPKAEEDDDPNAGKGDETVQPAAGVPGPDGAFTPPYDGDEGTDGEDPAEPPPAKEPEGA